MSAKFEQALGLGSCPSSLATSQIVGDEFSQCGLIVCQCVCLNFSYDSVYCVLVCLSGYLARW